MSIKPSDDDEPGSFIGRTFDVALDPTELDAFIDAWNSAGLETEIAGRSIEEIQEFGPRYLENLERAEVFLKRSAQGRPQIESFLEPFDSLAAFIVDRSMQVVAANEGTKDWLGLKVGVSINDIKMLPAPLADLKTALHKAIGGDETFRQVLRIDSETESHTMLFQVVTLSGSRKQMDQRHWSSPVSDIGTTGKKPHSEMFLA
jgi:hypothetical protein